MSSFKAEALAIEYSSQDKTSSPILAQLAAIVDQSWSATLPDPKLKQKLAQYDRPENCGTFLAPKINSMKSGLEFHLLANDKIWNSLL